MLYCIALHGMALHCIVTDMWNWTFSTSQTCTCSSSVDVGRPVGSLTRHILMKSLKSTDLKNKTGQLSD